MYLLFESFDFFLYINEYIFIVPVPVPVIVPAPAPVPGTRHFSY